MRSTQAQQTDGLVSPIRATSYASRLFAIPRKIRLSIPLSTLGLVCLALLIFFVFVAIFAEQLAPYDPLENNYSQISKPPSWEHWMGTDFFGRDLLSRVMYGLRVSLVVALCAVVLGDLLGFGIGTATGYLGGRIDLVTQRGVEILLAFPALILALLLMTALGAGLQTVILAIALTQIPRAIRISRSVSLSAKGLTYVDAARVVGAPEWRIIVKHIVPQSVPSLLVVASLSLGTAIFAEAALSYLGVGVAPPMPSLGNLLGDQVAQQFSPPWWLVVFPGITITVIILAANLLGDDLRDKLDPRLRRL